MITRKGYIYVHMPTYKLAPKCGMVMVHRVIYEEFYKCCMLPWGDVHHINGIKTDNRPENLLGMLHGKHSSANTKKDLSDRECYFCSSRSTRITHQIKKGRPYIGYAWHHFPGGVFCDKCSKLKEGKVMLARLRSNP